MYAALKQNHAGSILDSVGHTPLVPIKRINQKKGVTILAKLESFNPGGSVKDRIALHMIEAAEKRGELTRDKIILEASSGNTGIGLAMVCAVKGYRCTIAMSESASIERRQIMQAYGAEIILTPARLSTDGAIEEVYKMARQNPDLYYCTDQFNNPDNWKAHYLNTAMEIWEQTGQGVNAIISAMGTTGTLMGITKRFRELDPKVRIIGVEPYLGHRIQGLKNMKESYKPGIFDKHLPDEILNIHDDEAFEMTKRLAREEGIFAGMSSGAAMAAALKVAETMDSGVIVAIFPDGGERYLSTGLFKVNGEGEEEKVGTLRLTNTLTRKKEYFQSLEPEKAKIYSCGPTAYEYAHLGLCRRVVSADLLRRALEAQGYQVRHVMNITDIDDKTIRAALDSSLSLEELTDRYSRAFMEDVETLGVKKAEVYPRASEHIEEMEAIASQLIDKGFAYEKHGSVYFDVSKLRSYGRLSKVDLSNIDIGRTVDLDEYDKDSPFDFTLFKRVTLEELKAGIGHTSPWGQVRPGWHIECVAMATKYLGPLFDIHTSGCDLIFPHHENEIAMSMALWNQPLATTWLHSDLVLHNGKKMSRSAGNVVTLRDLLSQGYSGRQVRFFLMRTHYRKPLHFTPTLLDDAARGLNRLDEFVTQLLQVSSAGGATKVEGDDVIPTEVSEATEAFFGAVFDDLNVAKGLGHLFTLVRQLNPLLLGGEIGPQVARGVLEDLSRVDEILGVLDIPLPDPQLYSRINELVLRREGAREDQRWEEADAIREELAKMGIDVVDTPYGPRWRRKRDK